MPRRFQVERPDQLLILQDYVKDGNLTRAASIWRTAREKKGGKGASWDGKICVDFFAWDGKRTATVFRLSKDNRAAIGKADEIIHHDPPFVFAHLRYTPALHWCAEHLKEV